MSRNEKGGLSFLFVAFAGVAAWAAGADAGNLDFERGDLGWQLPPAYAVVKGEGMNGTAALVYANSDPKRPYAFPKYTLNLQTGLSYRVSAMIRTENLEPNKGRGAQLAILCRASDGTGAGEHYSAGVRGTEGWTRIEFVTRPISPKAAICTLAAYCTPQSVGKAYFDDILVVPYEKPAVGRLFSSAYRNVMSSGEVALRVDLAVPEKYAPGDMRGVFSYVNDSGVRVTAAVTPAARDWAGFTLDAAKLKKGRSEIGFELFAPDGAKLGATSLMFHRPARMPKRRVWIDGHRRTIVDGQPFFPLGMFSGSKNRFAEYVKGPFNTFMPYEPLDAVEMDFFHTNGIKVIYSVKDVYAAMAEKAPSCVTSAEAENAYVQAKVDAFRTHPALLAWYVNDERTLELFKPLRARQDLLERLDPDHPTWAVFYQYELLRQMAPTYDIVGTDPYPVPAASLSYVTAATRRTNDALFGLRPMWQVPQAFDWGVYRKEKPGAPKSRMPTAEEMRSMSWQFIAAGANGLIYYSFSTIQYGRRKDGTPFDFGKAWADVCAVGAEIRRYIPVLLAAEPAPTVTGAPDAWGVRVWRKDGETWLLVVNAQDAADAATLTLSEDFATVAPAFGPAAEKAGARALKVSLAPNEPAFYRIR